MLSSLIFLWVDWAQVNGLSLAGLGGRAGGGGGAGAPPEGCRKVESSESAWAGSHAHDLGIWGLVRHPFLQKSLHVTSAGFLTIWSPQGSWTSYMPHLTFPRAHALRNRK